MIAPNRKIDHNSVMATPDIIVASLNDDNELVFNLLSRGVDINTRDLTGFTPMHIACLHGNIGLVQGLLKHSKSVQPLDFSLRTRDGLSAWQIAMDNHHYEIAQLVANEAVQVPTAASHRPILS